MLPEIFFIIGPKCSGKTALGSALAERANMNLLSFEQFVKDHHLKGKDDETITTALIKELTQ
jgi:shikimate kinase